MTRIAEIVEEARRWPCDQVAELVDHLTLSLHHRIDSEVEGAWEQEVRRRISEIESGKVQGVPGDDVSRLVRDIVGR
jgi:putative addiction module component (TIGR02574 family)